MQIKIIYLCYKRKAMIFVINNTISITTCYFVVKLTHFIVLFKYINQIKLC